MKMNKWTMALAAAGVVSLSSVAQAQEAAAGANANANPNDYILLHKESANIYKTNKENEI